LPVLAQKAFESLIRKKVNVTSQKGLFATKQRHTESLPSPIEKKSLFYGFHTPKNDPTIQVRITFNQ
jgi:hypothetical protein